MGSTEEIQIEFERLGLGNMDDRQMFDRFAEKIEDVEHRVTFVYSNTSIPSATPTANTMSVRI